MIVGLATAGINASALAQTKSIDIPAGDLRTALETFIRESGVQLIYSIDEVKGVRSRAVHGELLPEDALRQLLKGTQFTIHQDASGGIVVSKPSMRTSATAPAARDSSPVVPDALESPNRAMQSTPQLEEIVVTAEKRAERLQDVPVPVTSVSANVLVDSNQLQLQDYYSRIPGLSVTPNNYGVPQVTIRGLTTGGFSDPTVGIVVDDVPYGPSSHLAFAEDAPDVDPSDLDRIEVLRGPQGTLYGASSLGGLLKYVTVDPSTAGLSGIVQAGTDSIYNGSGLGYNVRAAANIPLNDTLAIRASAFTRQDPGYVDNILTGQSDVNVRRSSGGRLSALWRPSADVSLKLSALVQRAKLDGSSDVEVGQGLGDLQQNVVRGAGQYDTTLQAYSATLNAKLGGIDLTSITGFNIDRELDSLDYTSILGDFTQNGLPGSGFAGFGVRGTPLFNHLNTSKFTQEIRLSAALGQNIEWLAGGFYDHENTSFAQDILASNALTGVQVGQWAQLVLPSTFAEYAAFADLTFHFTDNFQVQVGGRESHNSQAYTQTFLGVYDPVFLGVPSPVLYPKTLSSGNAFTYLVTPQFKISPDLMLYARLASGYRPGGPNIAIAAKLPSYQADTTRNYEIGAKGAVLDHMLSFDASLYYIDWNDVQLQVDNPTNHLSYTVNGSRAKSQGVELSVQARPLSGLHIGAWFTYSDAKLAQSFPNTSTLYGVSGDRLPYGSRISGNFSVDEEFPLPAGITGFVGAAVSYIGDRLGNFQAAPTRQDFPAYTKTDLRAGVRVEAWTVNLFVNNVANRRGLLGGGLDYVPSNSFLYIQPRTIGASLARKF